MSASRYPDNNSNSSNNNNNRYGRDRSPAYRDRRPSNFGGVYPPRGNEPNRANPEPGVFPPRDTPRGPKSLADTPRGPAPAPLANVPSGRGRGFPGRGEPTPLREAPPLSSGTLPSLNTHNSWRADRPDRDHRERDFDRRERRPSPPRRSPIRDSRDPRDQREFLPRDLDVNRARRNSREGPPSAGSTFSDAPTLGAGSSYRGSGIGRGRGGSHFGGRGRNFHNDDRDRHHEVRDRIPDRSYRPRSRSPPIRRERDPRDERDFDRRDRDDRRFVPREYDSYIGPAGAAKPGLRALDTHRGPGPSDLRHIPGTPTGPTPHSAHHVSPADRLGPQVDSYSRRSSVAMEPSSAKDSRRDPGKDDLLLASRAEASRERYAPRASSPPASIPAFGGSNVWRNPNTTIDSKPSTAIAPPPKPVQAAPPAPVAPATPVVAPANTAPTIPTAPKASISAGLSPAPPTGPKADRIPDRPSSDRPLGDVSYQGNRPATSGPPRMEPPPNLPPFVTSSPNPPPGADVPGPDKLAPKAPALHSAPRHVQAQSLAPPPPSTFSAPSGPSAPSVPPALAKSPPLGPAPKPRIPPSAPQAVLRANVSPSFSRMPHPPFAPRDTSPSVMPPTLGPRSGSGGASSMHTSPKTLPSNIPTGPKADRAPVAPRAPPMYPPSDRPSFTAPRAPMGERQKSMQWLRPGLVPNRNTVLSKREFPYEDRERAFGTAPKAPRLENSVSVSQSQRTHQAKSESPTFSRTSTESEKPRGRAASAERHKAPTPNPTSIEMRRHSDVFMPDASPRPVQPPASAASSVPEALQDSDDDLDLDEDDFAESETKYNRERSLLEARRVDLSAPHLRATSPLQEIILLSCLTADHLPREEPEPHPAVQTQPLSQAQEVSPSSPGQPDLEKATAELPTPRAEESCEEDVVMEVKEENEDREVKGERSIAPATVALRLRRERSTELEEMPDVRTLPYLGSGPPTPLSDIEQDRPDISDTVLLAIRDRLRKSLEPELDTEQTLRQYAAAYKQWRLSIHPWDEEREQDEQERQPSAEPGLKATTPDVQSAALAGLLDAQSAPTGRRGHSSRWATELDFEQVLKESLKTAEEERMGKREQEPKRAMADPEKEAFLPRELTVSEARRRQFIDTNFQREPGSGIFAFHYEPPEDDFTPEEHRVMVHNYKDQYAKKWGKLAEILYKEVGTERTYKDCINHYYATKWGKEYKGKLKGRRGGARKRGGATGRGRGAIANMDRPEASGEDGLPLALTESGRPKRSAAPTFGGMEIEFDTSVTVHTPGRPRRPTDADGAQEKASRRGKVKEKVGRKAKNLLPAAVPAGSPVKIDRKEKAFGVKMEDEYGKRPLDEMPMPVHTGFIEDPMLLSGDPLALSGFVPGMMERPKTQATARPGPSSYWSVSELQDFDKYVEHFGTDWLAIANHMGTKTHTMIKNQYLRHVESGKAELEQKAQEADRKRERGDNLGPPPMPTPAPKRRYESTQPPLPRNLAPTPELHNSPLSNPLSLPKLSPPHSTSSARFSAIAQAPIPSKALVAAHGNPSLVDTSLSSVPSMVQQQSPPPPPPRSQPQHRHQHTLSQHKPHPPGPRAGYFSDDLPPRMESRPPSQSSSINNSHRPLQHHMQTQSRTQEQHQPPIFRTMSHQERENRVRSELQQEQEAQQRYQQQQHHARRISQEMHHHRPFPPSGPTPLMAPVRSNSSSNVKSPEHRSLSYSHSRHISQSQEMGPQVHGTHPGAQQFPLRSAILTPPVKEESRHPPVSAPPQVQPPHLLPSQHQLHPQFGQSPMQNTPPPPAPKPAAEARKSNLMSLLNDPEPEEPRRKKPNDQGPPSHSTTPQQQMPIAPPPVAQSLPPRRDPYADSVTTQPPYNRSSYVQQTSLPSAAPNRLVDLGNDQTSGSRPGIRETWQQRQQFLPTQSQTQQQASVSSSHSGMAQSHFGDPRSFANHRAVFAPLNARHNPSPPPSAPLSAYSNSPHLHSRTPSLSGQSMQSSRHGPPSASSAQHPQATPGSTSQILQPNPYAQVDPPGSSAPPAGPMGMRPSPHLHTTHVAQQRDVSSRNEHSQMQNANLSYSNPQTPKEAPAKPMRIPNSMAESYRPRDLREALHDYESRNSDRDTSRELSQKTDFLLREQMSNQQLRSNGPPPMHDELRYQPPQQDRGLFAQRSHTPLSRSEHGQPPPLQHPPHSSLGTNNHTIYGQRPSEEPSHRFSQPLHRDRGIADRIREEQQQQHREEYMRREEMREREMRERERDAHFRESMMRRDPRAQPPGSGPGPGPDTRPPAGPMDWSTSARHPQDRWQR
ncbi:hypothetical protein P153DRAFT_397486 [Dothidotthia symphoricarpi CBS 119687]|uniref:Myb-like domain-containing protein n=1 Tax=Dothidotthia symphoricarpi CBS 119687 TaxID=1392245 RepID=A0A6A6A9C0_9PLEO|nr:uncharacterized protein P153DRAFT_397486 [Dothidotthia symphoricarpi CBS 119687]KAF2128410.1 hypothetical protein P153DRAFT_397486 [Dothidotthia symphoricarpi CBS 119687]